MNNQENDFPKADILLVDDKPENLRLLSALLEEQGYEVREAINGSIALKAAQAAPPDLILLDINMPGMSGYEVCQKLKTSESTREIPVIFISALNEAWDKVKSFSVGGADYITKPFKVIEVLARVKNHLMIRQLQKRLQEQNAQLRDEIEERKRAETALKRANQELQRLSVLDSLTQIANRRRFDEYLTQEWQQAFQSQQPLAMILCDVDFFKPFNDTYGHQAGDQCLYQVAQAIGQAIARQKEYRELVARYGGEEFAVILPGLSLEGVSQVAQAIQTQIHNLGIPHIASQVSEHVTVSMGISSVIPDSEADPATLISLCDQALYTAKAEGRDRSIIGTKDRGLLLPQDLKPL